MRAINPTVRVVGHFAGKDQKLEDASAVHPGAPLSAAQSQTVLDLGPYALDKAEIVSLNQPSTLPPFTTDGIVTSLGAGVTRGDGPNDLAPEHAESQRLADVLNRLAANKLDGAQFFASSVLSMQPWQRNCDHGPMDKPRQTSRRPRISFAISKPLATPSPSTTPATSPTSPTSTTTGRTSWRPSTSTPRSSFPTPVAATSRPRIPR